MPEIAKTSAVCFAPRLDPELFVLVLAKHTLSSQSFNDFTPESAMIKARGPEDRHDLRQNDDKRRSDIGLPSVAIDMPLSAAATQETQAHSLANRSRRFNFAETAPPIHCKAAMSLV